MYLNKSTLQHYLADLATNHEMTIKNLDECYSTNAWLIEKAKTKSIDGWVCICENQTQGVGRSKKTWVSSPGQSLTMSSAHRLTMPMSKLMGLSLKLGIGLVECLNNLGAQDLSLKWPNDIYYKDAKLGGILIESIALNDSSCMVVIGLGINLKLDSFQQERINQPVANLSDTRIKQQQYEYLLAELLNTIFQCVNNFPHHHLKNIKTEFQAYDYLTGKSVALSLGDKKLHGDYCGINEKGEICLAMQNHRIQTFSSGEVSIRLVS